MPPASWREMVDASEACHRQNLEGRRSPQMDSLSGLRILVVEDELLIAIELEASLEALGCEIVGPFARIADALEAVKTHTLDAAVLDVNVCGELIFPVSAALEAQGTPFVFCTGYADLPNLPEPMQKHYRLSKPCSAKGLQALLIEAMASARG